MTPGKNELKKDYVYRKIMEMISSNAVTDGRFPSEPEFCKLFNVSRVTLRSALKRLEKEGYITRSHYYGTRINRDRTAKKLLIASCFWFRRHRFSSIFSSAARHFSRSERYASRS